MAGCAFSANRPARGWRRPINVKPDEIRAKALATTRASGAGIISSHGWGRWHLRDIIDYQLIAMESCLYQAAVHREDLLRNFYEVGKRAIRSQGLLSRSLFQLISLTQGPRRRMLETLHSGRWRSGGQQHLFLLTAGSYEAGSYVIRMQQPYSAFAKTLLERQNYPDLRLYPGGPPKRPYDVTAQTLPLLMGVTSKPSTRTISAPLTRVAKFRSAATDSLHASNVYSWRAVNLHGRAARRSGAIRRQEISPSRRRPGSSR